MYLCVHSLQTFVITELSMIYQWSNTQTWYSIAVAIVSVGRSLVRRTLFLSPKQVILEKKIHDSYHSLVVFTIECLGS